MRIALFSDIHANLPALEAVLEDFERREFDALFCLGDLVGYAPWPNEVIEHIRSRKIPTIAGNYDDGVGRSSDDCGCAYKSDVEKARGEESIAYTNSIVTDENKAYLRGLATHMRLEFGSPADPLRVLMVHGSPRKINEYLFEDRPDKSFVRMMEAAGTDVMLFGHTHKPYHKVIAVDEGEGTRYLHAINIGSVGKPKDGDPRSCYIILETDEGAHATEADSARAEFIRVAYDVDRAERAVKASPLPDAFGDLLLEAV